MNIFYIFSCIFMLLCVPLIHGGCLDDNDTGHTSGDYNQRMWSYSSKSPVQPSTSTDLKFMTFNLQSGYSLSCVNNATLQALQMQGMDYVGTQETVQGVDTRCNYCTMPKIIADITGMSTRFFMTIPWRTGQFGTNIGSSQIILDAKYQLLQYSGVEQRLATAVKTQPLALQGRYLWHVNTHVEYYNAAARQSQIAQLVGFIQGIISADSSATIVLTGDFNGGPWDPMYTTLQTAGLKNAWEVFHGSIADGNTHPADWPSTRFDHIWFYQPSGVSITVKNAVVVNVQLSDHRPFTATLSFAVGGGGSALGPTNSPPLSPTASPTQPPSTNNNNNGGTVVCAGPLWEGATLNLACPSSSQKITSIQFASYGTPTGTCGNYKLGNCVGGSSMAVAVDKCLNRNSCGISVSNNVFGDPCPYVGKQFVMQVLCN